VTLRTVQKGVNAIAWLVLALWGTPDCAGHDAAPPSPRMHRVTVLEHYAILLILSTQPMTLMHRVNVPSQDASSVCANVGERSVAPRAVEVCSVEGGGVGVGVRAVLHARVCLVSVLNLQSDRSTRAIFTVLMSRTSRTSRMSGAWVRVDVDVRV
jgi:hypothetical protein